MSLKPANILVTGGYGCIGSESTKWLMRNTDSKLVICSRKVSSERTDRVFHDIDRDRLEVIEADVTDLNTLRQLLDEKQINKVIHMAALQTPDCNAHRDLGLQINLAGTQNLIEAIKSCKQPIDRFVFASSIAVYGPRSSYPVDRVPMLSEPAPVNVYGIWKLAGEHLARIFHSETGIPTVCLRPGVLFGPGRDAGLTASPTTAMKCIALGLPYQIPFRSKQDYQYAPDVGAAAGIAATKPFQGFGVYTLPGQTLETRQIVETLSRVSRTLGLEKSFDITVGTDEVPFICDLEFEPFLKDFPDVPLTPVEEAIQHSLTVFQQQVEKGWLTASDLPK